MKCDHPSVKTSYGAGKPNRGSKAVLRSRRWKRLAKLMRLRWLDAESWAVGGTMAAINEHHGRQCGAAVLGGLMGMAVAIKKRQGYQEWCRITTVDAPIRFFDVELEEDERAF